MPCTNPRCNHTICKLQKFLICPRTLVIVLILGVVLMMPKDVEGSCSVCCIYKTVLKTTCGFLELCIKIVEMPLSIICFTKSRLDMILQFVTGKCGHSICCSVDGTKPAPSLPRPPSEKRVSIKTSSSIIEQPPPKIIEESSTVYISEENVEDVPVRDKSISVVEMNPASIAPEPEREPKSKPELEESEAATEPQKKSSLVIKPERKSTSIIKPESETQAALELELALEPEQQQPDLEPERDLEPKTEPEEEPEELTQEEPYKKRIKSKPTLKSETASAEELSIKDMCERYTPSTCLKCRCARRKEARKRRSFDKDRYKVPFEQLAEEKTKVTVPDSDKLLMQTETDLDEHDKCCQIKSHSKCVGTAPCCRYKKRDSSGGSKRTKPNLKVVKRPSTGSKTPSVFIPSSISSKRRKSTDSKHSERKSVDSKRLSAGGKSSSRFKNIEQTNSKHSSAHQEGSADSKHPTTYKRISVDSKPPSVLRSTEGKRPSDSTSMVLPNPSGIKGSSDSKHPASAGSKHASADSKRVSVGSKGSKRDSQHSRGVNIAERESKLDRALTELSEEKIAKVSEGQIRRKMLSGACTGDSVCSLSPSLVDQTSFVKEIKDETKQTDPNLEKEATNTESQPIKDETKQTDPMLEKEATNIESQPKPCMCHHKELCRENCHGCRRGVVRG